MREFMVVKPHPVAMIQTPSGEYYYGRTILKYHKYKYYFFVHRTRLYIYVHQSIPFSFTDNSTASRCACASEVYVYMCLSACLSVCVDYYSCSVSIGF